MLSRGVMRLLSQRILQSLARSSELQADSETNAGRRDLPARSGLAVGTICCVVAVFAVMISSAQAQLPQVRLYSVFPAGGQAGTSVDLTVTSGADLEELSGVWFNQAGLTATPKTTMQDGVAVPVPNQFTVQIGADVPEGSYEIRVQGLYGLSNPRVFQVGLQTELTETEPNNATTQANEIALEQIVNGRINGRADLDWFRFTGKAGQSIIGQVWANRIDSRLDGALELYSPTGQRLIAARNTLFQDPLFAYTLPVDGEYRVRLYDYVYAGGEEYFYRLQISTRPYIQFAQPAVAVPGTKQTFQLFGKNLPGGQDAGITSKFGPLQRLDVTLDIPADPSPLTLTPPLLPAASTQSGFRYALETPNGRSNSLFFPYVRQAPLVETEPNQLSSQAMVLTLPAEVSGQFQTLNDVDHFRFSAKAGETYLMNVIAQRLGSDADVYFTLDQITTDDKQQETVKRIAAVDDDAHNALPLVFETLSDDPVYQFAVPADGTYQLTLRDRFGASRGDASLRYHLSIRPPQGDFQVVAIAAQPLAPGVKQGAVWSPGLRKGDLETIQVAVLRQEGFAGKITIEAEGLPPGINARPVTLGPEQNAGILVLESTEQTPAWTGTISIVGKSVLENPALSQAVVTAAQAVQAAQTASEQAKSGLAQATELAKQAKTLADQAVQASAANPADEAAKKAASDAMAALATAEGAVATAQKVVDDAQQVLTSHQTALQVAQTSRDQGQTVLTRPARFGTVVWTAPATQPAVSRLTSTLGLSVIDELAPYQIQTAIWELSVNQGSQILIPVDLIRRNGFDAPVTMTFVGQPANVQVENKPIPKEKSRETFRVFVAPNAPVGTYQFYLMAQAPVSYRRNLMRAELTKKEFDTADQAAKTADEAAKAAATGLEAATKALTTAQEAEKTAATAKTAADQALTTAQGQLKSDQEALEKAGDNTDAKTAAEQAVTVANAAVKTATDAQQKAAQTLNEAQVALKAAEQAKAEADKAVAMTAEALKAAQAKRTAAEQRFKAAEKVATPQNINTMPTSTPFILTIRPAPFTVAATPGAGGELKMGQTGTVAVTIKRQNNFAGPVTLNLFVPEEIKGLSAAPVTLAADQSEGTLTIQVAADAAEGAVPNAVIRVEAESEVRETVDAPITLKIAK